MEFLLSPYGLFLLLTADAAAILAVAVWGKRRLPEARMLFFILAAGTEWALCATFEAGSMVLETKLLWSRLSYIGMSLIPPFLLLFAFLHGESAKKLPLWLRLCLFLPAVVLLSLVLTNKLHGLVVKNVYAGPAGRHGLIFEYGPAFLALAAVNLIYFLLALWKFFSSARKKRGMRHFQDVLLIFSALFPLVGAVLYLTPIPIFPGLDLTLVGFLLSCICLAAGILRFQLLGFIPVTMRGIFNGMKDGVVILDMQNRIVEANPAAAEFSSSPEQPLPGILMTDRFPWWDRFESLAYSGFNEDVLEFKDGSGNTRTIEVRISAFHNDRGRAKGWLVIIHDVTRIREAENELLHALSNLKSWNATHTQDLLLARQIQKSLLPENRIRIPGVSINSAYVPCDELGGDIAGVLPVDETRIAVYGGGRFRTRCIRRHGHELREEAD